MTISGTLQAVTQNRLAYRSAELPPVTTGATFTPAKSEVLDPSLRTCPDLIECGDGDVDPGELCDDDNNFTCDVCSADCLRVDGNCGDGIRECGEACDDGNSAPGDGCEVGLRLASRSPQSVLPASGAVVISCAPAGLTGAGATDTDGGGVDDASHPAMARTSPSSTTTTRVLIGTP